MQTANSTSASHLSGVRLRALHRCASVDRHASADEDRVTQSNQLYGKRASVLSVGIDGMMCVQWHASVTPLGDAVSIAVP